MSDQSVKTIRDETTPRGKWQFDDDVTNAFDDMLRRSIPDYEEMRRLCFDVGCKFVRPATTVLDLGCSRGESMAPFVERFGAAVHHVGVEVSPPMLAAARERFKGYISCGVAEIRDDDLRTRYPPVRASLTLCVLTLQFTPIEHRQRIVRDAFRVTLPGGALILVEKVIGSTASADELLQDLYRNHKLAAGYTQDQVDRKRLSLEGVLVPVTAAWNEQLLHAAGFRTVECFWRRLSFCGWVAIRDE